MSAPMQSEGYAARALRAIEKIPEPLDQLYRLSEYVRDAEFLPKDIAPARSEIDILRRKYIAIASPLYRVKASLTNDRSVS